MISVVSSPPILLFIVTVGYEIYRIKKDTRRVVKMVCSDLHHWS